MKNTLTKLCSPILNYFETGEGKFIYKKSHRTILKVIGILLFVISSSSLYFSFATSQLGGMIPTLVFFTAGLVCLIVGFLGSDRAVANIWKRR